MDADRLGQWLTLGANIGILVGLVLVGMEIRQNSALTRAQLVDANFSDQQAQIMVRVGEDSAAAWARSIEDPGSLSLADIQIIEADLRATLLRLRRNAVMEEIGVFTGRWRRDFEWLSRPFTTPIGRAFWNYWYDDSAAWMREMQTYIDNAAPAMEADYMKALKDSLSPKEE